MRKILVLGRMNSTFDESLTPSDDTIITAGIASGAIKRLRAAKEIIDADYRVAAPILQGGRLFSGFMNELLGADLVIFNLSDISASVGYEYGIVQALGKPYFFVFSGDKLPDYFQGEIGVLGFQKADQFDGAEKSHVELYHLLKNCFSTSVIPTRFSRSQVTEYFDGLALSDVSAASGLAAGYFRNSLRRFERTSGFFGRKCSGVLRPAEQEPVGFSEKIPQLYIAVEPPSRLTDSYSRDFDLVEMRLKELGYSLVDFTINRGNDEADFRNFGGHVLAKIEQGRIIEPKGLIVLEVPTFLYALQYSALYGALFKIGLDDAEQKRRTTMEQEFFDSLILRVKQSIEYYSHISQVRR